MARLPDSVYVSRHSGLRAPRGGSHGGERVLSHALNHNSPRRGQRGLNSTLDVLTPLRSVEIPESDEDVAHALAKAPKREVKLSLNMHLEPVCHLDPFGMDLDLHLRLP